jgi:N-methylhydantoinase A
VVNVRVAAFGRLEDVALPELPEGDMHPPSSAAAGNVRVLFSADEGYVETSVWSRAELLAGNVIGGPAIVGDIGATTVLPPEFTCVVDRHGHLVVDVPRA